MELHSFLLQFNGWPAFCSLAFICLTLVSFYFKHNTQAINYWLFLGTLPSLLWNSNRLPEWLTEVFLSLGKGSIFIEGPMFSRLCYLVTCHPKNIEHILKTNFNNFPKGTDFKEIFGILGDGIFNVDADPWKLQRRMAHAGFTLMEFKTLVSDMSKRVVEDELVPFLTHVAEQKSMVIDLQDVCSRFAFDINIAAIFGISEGYLSIDLPSNELAEAVDDAQEAILYRHAMPIFLWKLLHWLGVGAEKRIAKAQRTVDSLFQVFITNKRRDLLQGVETVDLLSSYIKSSDEAIAKDDQFLRDAMLSLFIAGRDTIASGLIWFFWMVAKHPSVESKILEELKQVVLSKYGHGEKKWPWVFESDDLKGLVYLHAAMNESLRLFPPLPLNSKSVVKEDVLPDGTLVKPGMQMILSFYSVGRMPWIWGEDCLEFKPERWIDGEGKLSHELNSKFFAFNSGPRTCLGKDISYTQMKSAVAAVLFNFHVDVVEGQTVCPKPFINLHMKNGLKVTVRKRANMW